MNSAHCDQSQYIPDISLDRLPIVCVLVLTVVPKRCILSLPPHAQTSTPTYLLIVSHVSGRRNYLQMFPTRSVDIV